jgi:hypothetical protein
MAHIAHVNSRLIVQILPHWHILTKSCASFIIKFVTINNDYCTNNTSLSAVNNDWLRSLSFIVQNIGRDGT